MIDKGKRSIIFIIFFVSISMIVFSNEDISVKNVQHYRHISNYSDNKLYEIAEKFDKEGKSDSTLLYFNILYNRYNEDMSDNSKYLCAKSLLKSGNIFYSQSNYNKSMDLLLKCVDICERNSYNAILADVYRSLGNIYSSHTDYERSIMFYLRSLSISDSLKDSSLKSKVLNNLIGAYSFEGKKEDAKRCYDLLCATNDSDVFYKYNVLIGGGLVASADKNVDKASENYRLAADYALKNSLGIKYTGAAYSLLAALYENNVDSALYYLHINESAARANSKNDLLVETLRCLATLYKKIGDHNKWITYQTEYLNLSNEVFNQREFNSLKNMDFLYELNKSNKMINTLNLESKQKDHQISTQRQVLLILVVGVLIFICFGLVIYFQKRKLTIAYNDLFDKNLENLEKEKRYLSRLHELERQLEKNAITDIIDIDNVENTEDNLPKQVYEKLQKDILNIMKQTNIVCDSEFSIKKLAELVNSNTTYVSRVINEMTGNNFRAFLNEYRVKESMLRLNDTENYGNWTIKAIAESVGYKSQSNFISVFTKYTGIKPSMYQKIAIKHKSG